MLPSTRKLSSLLAAFLLSGYSTAVEVEVGYDVYAAAQSMIELSSHSWEWGTTAEALLELHNPEYSVYSSNPFPGGRLPRPDPKILALKYARQFINTNSQILVADAAIGDPASLGVSALLLGQSESKYTDAANRQADYILNDALRYSNGAISHRPEAAALWADNVAMSFPFLAYLAVQNGNVSLMTETVHQIGLHRAVLKADNLNWRHIIGPQSQDTGLWSTGNGWVALGMTRVLYTLQKWSGSSGSLGSQAGQLKSWIKEILDGAMQSGKDNGLLRNYLNDDSWFGEVSGTALLSAMAYRMAVNDPGMFGKSYITWADTNRKSLAGKEKGNGVFSPAVNPYNWKDPNQYTSGSPEGQAFVVLLYTAYRDCVKAGICDKPASTTTTISKPGIGPIDILTVLDAPMTFSAMPDPTGTICGAAESCDKDGCAGSFGGDVKFPTCTGGRKKGCQCKATEKTCGPHASCDAHGCAGSFNGLGNVAYPQCTGNFQGCECTPTSNTCGPRQSCDKNGCAGSYNGLGNVDYPQCTGNFKGCECLPSEITCGPRQSCDKNGCAGSFNELGNVKYPQCSGNFKGCECTATERTCGAHQSCNLNGCAGSFNGLGNVAWAKCTGNFVGCDCEAQPEQCGSPQDCSRNACDGEFNLDNGKAYCAKNFRGCECKSNPATCGDAQSCDKNHCDGKFNGLSVSPTCSNFFKGCVCQATDTTCGPQQSCDNNGCNGGYDSKSVARCQGNFRGCKCKATTNTCGEMKNCDLNGCNGSFDSNSNTARCRGNFKGCACIPVASTCGEPDSCSADGCKGSFNNGNPICTENKFGCPCIPDPIWIPPPPWFPPPITYTSLALISHGIETPQPHQVFPNRWHVFNINGVFTGDALCMYRDIVDGPGGQPYPDSMPTFDIEHFTNCRYSGSRLEIGSMSCDGATSVECFQTKGGSNCNNVATWYPDTVLFWVIQCTIKGPGSR